MDSLKRRSFAGKVLIFLIAAMLVSGTGGTALADKMPEISGADIKCSAGDTVEYSVSVSDNPGIAAFFVTLKSDSNNISFGDTVSRGDFCDSGTILASTRGSSVNVSWFDLTNVGGSGVLFTIGVTVAPDTPDGTYPITVKVSGENTIDEDGNEVAFEAVGGSIKVTGGKAPAPTETAAPETGGKKEIQPTQASVAPVENTKPPELIDEGKQPDTAVKIEPTADPDKKPADASEAKQTDSADKKPTDIKKSEQPDEDGTAYGDTVLGADTATVKKDDTANDTGVYEVQPEDSGNSTWVIAVCAVGVIAAAVLLILRTKSKNKNK